MRIKESKKEGCFGLLNIVDIVGIRSGKFNLYCTKRVRIYVDSVRARMCITFEQHFYVTRVTGSRTYCHINNDCLPKYKLPIAEFYSAAVLLYILYIDPPRRDCQFFYISFPVINQLALPWSASFNILLIQTLRPVANLGSLFLYACKRTSLSPCCKLNTFTADFTNIFLYQIYQYNMFENI